MSYRTKEKGIWFDNVSDYAKEHKRLSYRDIITRENIHLVMCNQIGSIDPSIYDNMRFNWYYKDEEGNEIETEIFQYFIVNCSQWDIEYLQENYGDNLLFTYSDLLECYILCVDHYGTSWDYVLTDVEIEEDGEIQQ